MTGASQRLKVLVLGVGGNVSQGIQKALALTHHEVLAACVDKRSAGLYLANRSFISPLADDESFGPWLLDLAAAEHLDAVLSGSEPVVWAIAARAHELLKRSGTVAIASPQSVLEIGEDKLATCRFLEQHGLPFPAYASGDDDVALRELAERCGFPLIAKPRRGKASQGVRLLETARDLQGLGAETLVQEHLGAADEEYTVGCLCDSTGLPYSTVVMHRTLQNGTTATAQIGHWPEVSRVAEDVVTALRPVGPCNIQLRRTARGPVPFELNVRFSGTTPLRARAGFNDVDAALRHLVLGEQPMRIVASSGGHVLRYWNEIYVPEETFGELGHPRAGVQVEDWGINS